MNPSLRLAPKMLKYLPSLWGGRPIPIYCQWDITYRCNLRCRHCILSQSEGPLIGELTTSEALELIERLAAAGTLIMMLEGGEPTLRDDLGQLIQAIKKAGMFAILTSNGQRIGEVLPDLKGVDWVRISIHGDRPTHDGLTGVSGSWDRALEAVGELINTGIKTGINCIVTPNTSPAALETLIRTVADWNVQVDLSPVLTDLRTISNPQPGDRRAKVESLRLPLEQFLGVAEHLHQKYGRLVTSPYIYRLLLKSGGLGRLGCKVMNTSIMIRPDGSFAFPCYDFPVKIMSGFPKAAMNSPEAEIIRKKQGTYWFCRDCYSRCWVISSFLVNPWKMLWVFLTYGLSRKP